MTVKVAPAALPAAGVRRPTPPCYPIGTGSFLVNWRLNRYLLSPDGRLALRAVRTDG